MIRLTNTHSELHTSTKKFKFGVLSLAVSIGSGAMLAPAAFSQDATASAEEDFLLLEEIIVTATKREQRLQDVPISISALNEDMLSDIGAQGFKDFYRAVPGLSFNESDAGRGSFNIRGVSTSTGISDNQSPVAVYVNELPTDDSRGGRSVQDLTLFDVERVEVLRGPQGTLFGSGALGGAIRIITNEPNTEEFEAKLATTVSSIDDGGDSYSVKGMVNIPLADDKLALRAVGMMRREAGFVDNLATQEDDVNSVDVDGYRVSLKYWANSDLEITAYASHESSENNESGSLIPVIAGNKGVGGVRNEPLGNFLHTELDVYNLKVEYQLDWAEFMSSTTYSKKETDILQGNTDGLGPGFSLVASGPDKNITIAQEFRFTSMVEGPLTWVAGVFYLERDRDAGTKFEIPEFGPFGVLFDVAIETLDEELAVYGETTYAIDDQWAATVGLRWFENTAEYSDVGLSPVPGVISETVESAVTPKFVLSYTPNDDMMTYLSVSKGYRIGGTNVPIVPVPVPATPESYDSDSLWNYELGLKGTFFGNRLLLTAAMYYIDWEDIQVELEEPVSELSYNTNAGRAVSQGAELEFVFRPAKGWEVTSSWAWNDTEIKESVEGTLISQGDELPGARDLSIAHAIEYSYDTAQMGTVFARLDHQNVGKADAGFRGLADSNPFDALEEDIQLDSYSVTNFRVGVRRDSWSATFFVDNLSNDDTLVSVSPNGTSAFQLKPRTFGIDFIKDF